MSDEAHVVLVCPIQDEERLKQFVEDCLSRKVESIYCWGAGSERVHDALDEIIVGDSDDPERFILTTWHSDESLSEVRDFASGYGARPICEVRL